MTISKLYIRPNIELFKKKKLLAKITKSLFNSEYLNANLTYCTFDILVLLKNICFSHLKSHISYF